MRKKILWSDETKIELFGQNSNCALCLANTRHCSSREAWWWQHHAMWCFSAAGTGRLVRRKLNLQ
ncbi:hypothetical protein LDENG_00236980 [Lucifuga dentata]|nr:hypothetical protein LDENG_00236980 [Lucifuga dentata]